MNCETFETRLNQLLDDRATLELDAQAAEHSAGCASCRQLYAAYEQLAAASDHSAVSCEEDRRIESHRIETETRSAVSVAAPGVKRGRLRLVIRVGAVAAACLLAAVVLWHRDSDAPPAPAAAAPPLGELARDATARYLELAGETKLGLADAMLLAPGAGQPQSGAEGDDAPGLISQLAEGFNPLAESTSVAVSALFTMTPLNESPRDATPLDATPLNVEPRDHAASDAHGLQ